MTELDSQAWTLLADAAVSALPWVVVPAVGAGVFSVWVSGRLFNRAWGMAERDAFLTCAAAQCLFLTALGSLWTATMTVQTGRTAEPTQELTWQDLRRAQDGTLKRTDDLILRLTEDCLSADTPLAKLRPLRRDVPNPDEEGMREVRLALEAFLADPHVVVENRHDFYRKLTLLCHSCRLRCAERVLPPPAYWRARLLQLLWGGWGFFSFLSAFCAYRCIRYIPVMLILQK